MQSDQDLVNDVEGLFLDHMARKEKQASARRATAAGVAERKSRQLMPLRQLLKRLVDRGLIVSHADRSGASRKSHQAFQVYENESSEGFLPGISIFIDHPAQIEIAIPNEGDQARLGVVAIMCATNHPDRAMLQGPFRNMRDAAMALMEFIARSTVSVERPQ